VGEALAGVDGHGLADLGEVLARALGVEPELLAAEHGTDLERLRCGRGPVVRSRKRRGREALRIGRRRRQRGK
jgi:hypothetical protein